MADYNPAYPRWPSETAPRKRERVNPWVAAGAGLLGGIWSNYNPTGFDAAVANLKQGMLERERQRIVEEQNRQEAEWRAAQEQRWEEDRLSREGIAETNATQRGEIAGLQAAVRQLIATGIDPRTGQRVDVAPGGTMDLARTRGEYIAGPQTENTQARTEYITGPQTRNMESQTRYRDEGLLPNIQARTQTENVMRQPTLAYRQRQTSNLNSQQWARDAMLPLDQRVKQAQARVYESLPQYRQGQLEVAQGRLGVAQGGLALERGLLPYTQFGRVAPYMQEGQGLTIPNPLAGTGLQGFPDDGSVPPATPGGAPYMTVGPKPGATTSTEKERLVQNARKSGVDVGTWEVYDGLGIAPGPQASKSFGYWQDAGVITGEGTAENPYLINTNSPLHGQYMADQEAWRSGKFRWVNGKAVRTDGGKGLAGKTPAKPAPKATPKKAAPKKKPVPTKTGVATVDNL